MRKPRISRHQERKAKQRFGWRIPAGTTASRIRYQKKRNRKPRMKRR
jgi:hypothetical protein